MNPDAPLKIATLRPFRRTSDGSLCFPEVVIDFYAAELASRHASAVEAFRAAGISEQLAVRAAGAICEEAPLSAVEIDDGNSVCAAQLPDGQFGLFCGCSNNATTDEAAIERDVKELSARHGTEWIIVVRHRICGFDTPSIASPVAAGTAPGVAP